ASGAGFTTAQVLARRLQRHFTGNPHFEGLPKKFKIAVETSERSGRHLIQDVGLVLTGCAEGIDLYDVWIAGGLGREPRPGFRLREGVPAPELLSLIEAIVRTYAKHAPAPKRLKFLAASHGENGLRELIAAELGETPKDFPLPASDVSLTPAPAAAPLEVPVFAGEMPASQLRRLATLARAEAGGALVVSCDQNILFYPVDGAARERLIAALASSSLNGSGREAQVTFRICPGDHECRMGLSATRDLAREALAAMSDQAAGLSWAISGCPNACSQPQLADIGIITRKRQRDAAGTLQPRFELLRRSDSGFATTITDDLDQSALLAAITAL
ncbi:MAG: nitrite/sulfite reductase, partial [Gemmatimonadales bacterium]